jgi:translocator protein
MNGFKLIISLLLCYGVAAAGSIVTTPAISGWYESLQKPYFNPPNWVFGPVWTVLYALMGIALYLVWKKAGKQKKEIKAIQIFAMQLALNFLWSFMFFGLHAITWGLLTICLLWVAIAFTIIMFKPISRTASLLLLPYLIWVSFAFLLNGAIFVLN